MNKYVSNITLAIIIAILPFLGFPPAWKSFFIFVLAIIVAIISFYIYKEETARHPRSSVPAKSTAYVDNLNESIKNDTPEA